MPKKSHLRATEYRIYRILIYVTLLGHNLMNSHRKWELCLKLDEPVYWPFFKRVLLKVMTSLLFCGITNSSLNPIVLITLWNWEEGKGRGKHWDGVAGDRDWGWGCLSLSLKLAESQCWDCKHVLCWDTWAFKEF